MFTGIIQAVGKIRNLSPQGGDQRLTVDVGKLDMQNVGLGDSIAVNGVCLTAIDFGNDFFTADVSNETLACTTLGTLNVGSAVNLEKAVTPTTHLGGHIVSGHVDGVGEIVRKSMDGRSIRFSIQFPETISRYIAGKGSICVEGISLTVNAVQGNLFELNIVPHTVQETNLNDAEVGKRVNLEVDIIARYLERLLTGAGSDEGNVPSGGVTLDTLARAGFPLHHKT